MEIEGKRKDMHEKHKKEDDEFTIWDWFKKWMFYHYGMVYMGARMLNNISAAML
jgi:hypothetical protein